MSIGADAYLEELLETLPACRRCRAHKRRCDTLLPSCRNCSKSGTDCIFFDHILNEDLPRSYISSLVAAFKESHSSDPQEPIIDAIQNDVDFNLCTQRTSRPSHCPPTPISRYLGNSAILSQSPLIQDQDEIVLEFPKTTPLDLSFPFHDVEQPVNITPEVHRHLIQIYFSRIHPVYPFLDEKLTFLSLAQDTANLEPSEVFILQMVYSIACHCEQDIGTRLVLLSDACHTHALKHIEIATANLNLLTLQAVILLAIRCLFDPQKGSFAQFIAFAGRLVIDIGGQDISTRGRHLQNIHTTIFCLENQFATVLDRPSFLPEPNRTSPITFDFSRPSEFLCSLYRVQCKYKNGATTEAKELMLQVPFDKISENTHSIILTTIYETQLLLDPSPTIASRLINSYSDPSSILTFTSPQWAYKAGIVLLHENSGAYNAAQVEAYGRCLLILAKASIRWEGAKVLSTSLASHLKKQPEVLKCTIGS